MSQQAIIEIHRIRRLYEHFRTAQTDIHHSGLVHTPFELVESLLGQIPTHVWKNPNNRWLDPACGRGSFLLIIKEGLLRYHSEKHIVEKMLFGVDILPKNIHLTKHAINPLNKYNDNISQGNSLERDWEGMKFDVVASNYPFGEMNADGTRKSRTSSLWKKFVRLVVDHLLVEGGYVVAIHPESWMSPNTRDNLAREIFLSNQLLYLNVLECGKYFPQVGALFTSYVMQKIQPTTPTEVICLYEKQLYHSFIDFSKKNTLEFLPLLLEDRAISIIEKTLLAGHEQFGFDSSHQFTRGGNRIGDKLAQEKRDAKHPYPLWHTPNQKLWCSKPHVDQNKIKVVVPTTTYYERLEITKFGVTQACVYVVVSSKREAEQLKKVLMSKLYRFIARICRWGNWNNERLIGMFPYVDLSRSWNDEKLMDYFGLSPKEKVLVRETIDD